METDFLTHFEQLYRTFSRDLKLAGEITSPNAEDTLETKASIVGFSYHRRTEEWSKNQHTFVCYRLTDSGLSLTGERLFFALSLGYLLGLHSAGEIDDVEFGLAEVQLPGFILLKGGKF